jgi:hypothetical protein
VCVVRNHDEKNKDMVESVLPSTARKRARCDRRTVHKKHRARQRTRIHAATDGSEFDECSRPPDLLRRRDLNELVWDRRAADKVGSLVHWALVTVERSPELRGAPLQEQVQHFAALLPANLIGRHAVQHIESGLRWEMWRAASAVRATPSGPARQYVAVRAKVAHILETGRHADLNARIRALVNRQQYARYGGERSGNPYGHLPRSPYRMLLGLHDLDAFTSAGYGDAEIGKILDDILDDRTRPQHLGR